MESPTPFYNTEDSHPRGMGERVTTRLRHARARFQRLNRSKQGVLVSLALLGALVLTGTFAYAITPDGGSNSPALVAHLATATPDPFTGSYVLADASHTEAQILTLHAYHGGFTGTLQTLTCLNGPHTTLAIVTGKLATDGALQLTLTLPNSARSTQATYRVLRDTDGTALYLQDSQEEVQTQPWTRLTQSATQYIAGWC